MVNFGRNLRQFWSIFRRNQQITAEEFNKLISPLLNMSVSLPWKGYGSALFLELGKLKPKKDSQNYPEGEACIIPNWEWRIENDKKIVCGSSDSNPKIEDAIKLLEGLTVDSITLNGKIPELIIHFSKGYILATMTLTTGEPQWHIKCIDGKYIYFEKGSLVQMDGDEAREKLSKEEEEILQLASNAAERWNKPLFEPIKGNCQKCKYFVRIDGEYYLIDYGVCISSKSKFDGQVVNLDSGCPEYLTK